MRRDEVTPVIAKRVVVALVEVLLVEVRFVIVPAVAVNPALNAIEVVVALPINGYAIVLVITPVVLL